MDSKGDSSHERKDSHRRRTKKRPCIEFSATLELTNGPVGITVSGTELVGDPIIISGLVSGKPAERSKLFAIGDEIIAINGHSVKDKTLAQMVQMFESNRERITLTVLRDTVPLAVSQPSLDNSHELDLWSQQVDSLDHLETCSQASDHSVDSSLLSTPLCTASDMSEEPATLQDHLQEVQREMKQMLTPVAAEVIRLVLTKEPQKSFGFSLSDGVFEKGVYISGVLKDSCADVHGLRTYDRILQVNEHPVQDRLSSVIKKLISESQSQLILIVSRNPLVHKEALHK